ncbi:helix-turn-helix transcriptional regulator [Kitasatospora sp. NPDC008050]|uniref:helix-turn-helix domain-containing protein n=1 Tax=Kitasatospora sp. NPDC008050 TaxID=3364021 RepID=UPI0036EDEAE5
MTSDIDSTVEAAGPLAAVAELLVGLSGQLERWQAELALAQAQVRSLTEQNEQNERSGSSESSRLREQGCPATLSCEEAVGLVVAVLAGDTQGVRHVRHVRSSDSAFLDRLRARGVVRPSPRLSVRELLSCPVSPEETASGEDNCLVRTVRTVWTELDEVLIIDEAMALIPAPDAVHVTVVQNPSVVRQLVLFFEAARAQAAHPAESVPIPGTEVELKQRIVRMLAEGAKDETVARRLGISLRTCRRHIAEILHQLGASSRFQAGVRAATLGAVPVLGQR